MRPTLTPDELAAYELDRRDRVYARFTTCGLIAFAGYASFFYIDWAATNDNPQLLHRLWATRAGHLFFLALLTLASRTAWAHKHAYGFSRVLCVYIAAGSVLLSALAHNEVKQYATGVLLVLIGWNALMPWRTIDAAVSYFFVLLFYALTIVGLGYVTIESFVIFASYMIGAVVCVVSVHLADSLALEKFLLLQIKDRVLANVSHELRTPIMLMLASVETLNEKINTDGAHNYQFRLLNENGTRLLRMVDNFLELSRLDSGQEQLTMSHWSILRYLQEKVAEIEPLAAKKNIEIDFKCPLDNVNIYADAHAINVVVNNLLANAIKFSRIGGQIDVTLDIKHDLVLLTVADNGPGISAEEKEMIWSRFQQGREARNLPNAGVGIGLSMCQRYVVMHRGTIEVGDAHPQYPAAKGAKFTVVLPKGPNAATPQTPIVTADLERKSTATHGLAAWDHRLRQQDIYRMSLLRDAAETRATPEDIDRGFALSILIVDDNEDMLKVIDAMIASEYNGLFASDGQDGFERAKRLRPSLIISDVSMPRVDGFDMLKMIRKHPDTCDIPVVMMTARGGKDDRSISEALQADAYLEKGFTGKALRPILQRLLQRHLMHVQQAEAISDSAVKVVIARLAHELFNPLSWMEKATVKAARKFDEVAGHARQTSADSSEAEASHARAMASLRESHRIMLQLVKQLKDFSKDNPEARICVRLTELIQRTVAVTDEASHINTVFGTDASVSVLQGQMERVLLNLIKNAIEAGSAAEDITVRTFEETENNLVGIEVADHGKGMDQRTLERTFEPRFTTKATGSGLGLAICRDVVKKLGGTISVQSAEGRGTIFTILLPAAPTGNTAATKGGDG